MVTVVLWVCAVCLMVASAVVDSWTLGVLGLPVLAAAAAMTNVAAIHRYGVQTRDAVEIGRQSVTRLPVR